MSEPDLYCNECGTGMRWGEEYPLPDAEDDSDAVCSPCRADLKRAGDW